MAFSKIISEEELKEIVPFYRDRDKIALALIEEMEDDPIGTRRKVEAKDIPSEYHKQMRTISGTINRYLKQDKKEWRVSMRTLKDRSALILLKRNA